MLYDYQEAHLHSSMKIGNTNWDLNKVEKIYLDAYISQISTKTSSLLREKLKMCLTKIVIQNCKYMS